MKLLVAAVLLAALVAAIWASDRITLQGERTVYTVRCEGGDWQGSACTGRLVAGDRYTFRASRSRNEVLYWIVGSNVPSGKYANCRVHNRGNWTCTVASGEPRTIIDAMRHDHPASATDAGGPTFHAVPKWKWWAIRYGIGRFRSAGS